MQFVVGVLWNISVVLLQLDCDEYCKNTSEFLCENKNMIKTDNPGSKLDLER